MAPRSTVLHESFLSVKKNTVIFNVEYSLQPAPIRSYDVPKEPASQKPNEIVEAAVASLAFHCCLEIFRVVN